MFCGRCAVVSFGPPQAEIFWENSGFFTQEQAKTILFFGGVKMVPYIHIFYTSCRRRKQFCFGGQNGVIYITYTFFTQPNAGEKIRGFCWLKWCHIYKFWVFLGRVKMVLHIHILNFFWWSKCCHIHTFFFWWEGGGQNATICILRGVWV